ncbi:OmpA family protein [Phragmitibacter flavus]|uniref:OmpA family protein n=1 Tax=Phragmitibacter flavus TaxID=2576071 RepID=A0A5R8KB16_9BACT|nr:OmpA family protein [Phragmitibacter flavus]TLD69504.1 OmpA family protein [Phragmitibacter flavus]
MKTVNQCVVATFGVVAFAMAASAADMVKGKDPEGVKRYEGSTLIAHQTPKYDEYFAPQGKERSFGKSNPFGESALKLEGHVERWTYLVPDAERTTLEVFVNYRDEFKRLGLETVYAPGQDEDGWTGPTYGDYASKMQLGQILEYNENEERLMIAKTKDAEPTYYVLFVTSYADGIIPTRLDGVLKKKMPLVQLDVISPTVMEEKMVFVKAEEMKSTLDKSGHIALYGLNFDTDKDELKEESKPSLAEVAKLLKTNPSLKLYVVGHTDNEGSAEYNVDLSKRRAAHIVKALGSEYGIAASRLASHGSGLYCPVATNGTEEGRAKNRRVELVEQ